MRTRAFVPVLGLALLSLLLVDAGAAWARAGAGGSRGSRSYSAPARPAPSPVPASPTSPSRPLSPPGPSQAQGPSFFSGLMGGIAGFALGGLIGSLLFGGMGQGFGGGIGLLEILLIGAGVVLLLRAFRARATTPEPAYAGSTTTASRASATGSDWSGGTAVAPPPSELDRGIAHIRQMDPGFDPVAFAQWAQRVFSDVQEAIARRDVGALADRLTPQEYARLQGQCDQLRSARQTNRVERIEFERVEVTEAWQENGQDWATVYVAASLVDYTVDDVSGALVDGSRTPQDVEEYWTFTRPVGPAAWRLSAIQAS